MFRAIMALDGSEQGLFFAGEDLHIPKVQK
jgi:hypothetical protein